MPNPVNHEGISLRFPSREPAAGTLVIDRPSCQPLDQPTMVTPWTQFPIPAQSRIPLKDSLCLGNSSLAKQRLPPFSQRVITVSCPHSFIISCSLSFYKHFLQYIFCYIILSWQLLLLGVCYQRTQAEPIITKIKAQRLLGEGNH